MPKWGPTLLLSNQKIALRSDCNVPRNVLPWLKLNSQLLGGLGRVVCHDACHWFLGVLWSSPLLQCYYEKEEVRILLLIHTLQHVALSILKVRGWNNFELCLPKLHLTLVRLAYLATIYNATKLCHSSRWRRLQNNALAKIDTFYNSLKTNSWSLQHFYWWIASVFT